MVRWKTASQEAFPPSGQTVEFKLNGGKDWEAVTVDLPIEGRPGIVRLYLPADQSPVEVESIRFLSAGTKKVIRDWNFGGR
jgi:hypothetical protein